MSIEWVGQKLNEKFKTIRLSIDNILLDPNNYRIISSETEYQKVPEERIGELEVQEDTQALMEQRGELDPLIKSILRIGFLPIDRVVVRLWKDGKYVVVEGNRRIAAIKKILKDYERGRISLREDVLNSIKEIEVLVIDEEKRNIPVLQNLIQGIRHVQGVKGWGPYERAMMIKELYESCLLYTSPSPRDRG